MADGGRSDHQYSISRPPDAKSTAAIYHVQHAENDGSLKHKVGFVPSPGQRRTPSPTPHQRRPSPQPAQQIPRSLGLPNHGGVPVTVSYAQRVSPVGATQVPHNVIQAQSNSSSISQHRISPHHRVSPIPTASQHRVSPAPAHLRPSLVQQTRMSPIPTIEISEPSPTEPPIRGRPTSRGPPNTSSLYRTSPGPPAHAGSSMQVTAHAGQPVLIPQGLLQAAGPGLLPGATPGLLPGAAALTVANNVFNNPSFPIPRPSQTLHQHSLPTTLTHRNVSPVSNLGLGSGGSLPPEMGAISLAAASHALRQQMLFQIAAVHRAKSPPPPLLLQAQNPQLLAQHNIRLPLEAHLTPVSLVASSVTDTPQGAPLNYSTGRSVQHQQHQPEEELRTTEASRLFMQLTGSSLDLPEENVHPRLTPPLNDRISHTSLQPPPESDLPRGRSSPRSDSQLPGVNTSSYLAASSLSSSSSLPHSSPHHNAMPLQSVNNRISPIARESVVQRRKRTPSPIASILQQHLSLPQVTLPHHTIQLTTAHNLELYKARQHARKIGLSSESSDAELTKKQNKGGIETDHAFPLSRVKDKSDTVNQNTLSSSGGFSTNHIKGQQSNSASSFPHPLNLDSKLKAHLNAQMKAESLPKAELPVLTVSARGQAVQLEPVSTAHKSSKSSGFIKQPDKSRTTAVKPQPSLGSSDFEVSSDGSMPHLVPEASVACPLPNGPSEQVVPKVEEEDSHIEMELPFNRRLTNLNNFPANSTTYRATYRSHAMAIHKSKAGSITGAANSLDLLRQNLQSHLNKEIDAVIQSYIENYFKPGIENIKWNTGESAVSDDLVLAVCRQILEEAKKMYESDTRSVSPAPDIADNVSEAGSLAENKVVRLNKQSLFRIRKRRNSSDSEASIPRKKKKGRPPLHTTGRSTPSKQSKSNEPVKREAPKWDPERIKPETLFVMGARANKAVGLGQTRGRLYIKHPELFKYSGDGEDKQWLHENHHMPATGGKAYMLIAEDIEELAQTPEYRGNPSLCMSEIVGFMAPDWMQEKIRKQMQSLRTDVDQTNNAKPISSRSSTPIPGTQNSSIGGDDDDLMDDSDLPLPFSSLSAAAKTLSDSKGDISECSPCNTENLDLLSTEQDDADAVSPFNVMSGSFGDVSQTPDVSPAPSDLDALDDDGPLSAPFEFTD